jgi:hypothetical protein
MFRAAVVLAIASVLLLALALISVLSEEDKRKIRAMPRWAWLLVILFVPTLGPLAYFAFGRPAPGGKSGSAWPLSGFPEPPQPRAPDDDPEFLRSLDQPTISKEDEELLQRWEEDLKRREDEQRRRDHDN